MKMTEFTDLGNIIDQFNKKEKVASVIIPDESAVQKRVSVITKNVIDSPQATESEKLAAQELKKEIDGSIFEKVASINRQKEDYLLSLAEKMGESYAKGIKKVANDNVPLDAIAAQAEAAANAVQAPPPDAGIPGAEGILPEGDQKTIEEVKDTAAAAVSAVAATLADVAEAKGAESGGAPMIPEGEALPQIPVPPAPSSNEAGGILPSDMENKIASKLVPTKEEKEKNKIDKTAEGIIGTEDLLSSAMAEGEGGGDEEALAAAEVLASQIVEGMRKTEEGEVPPPATAIGESIDDKIKEQIIQSILSGDSASAESAAGPEAGAQLPEGIPGEEEMPVEGEPSGEDGDELAEALMAEESAGEGAPESEGEAGEEENGGEEDEEAYDALLEEDSAAPESEPKEDTSVEPEIEPGDEGEAAAAEEGEAAAEGEAAEATPGEEIDPELLALLEEGGAPEAPEGAENMQNPEVMAAAAEIAQRLAEEESKKKV